MMPRLRARWFVSRCVLGKRLHRFLRNYEGQPRGTRQRKYINTPRAGPPKNGGPFLFVRLFRKAKAEVLPVKPTPPPFFCGECVHVEEAIGVERRTYFFLLSLLLGSLTARLPKTTKKRRSRLVRATLAFRCGVRVIGEKPSLLAEGGSVDEPVARERLWSCACHPVMKGQTHAVGQLLHSSVPPFVISSFRHFVKRKRRSEARYS